MKKIPAVVLIVSAIYIATGAIGLTHHISDFTGHSLQYGLILIALLRLAAIVSGVFMLLGQNWARWLAIVWIAFHVAISFLNSPQQVAVHAVIFALIVYLLFRPEVRTYFKRKDEAAV